MCTFRIFISKQRTTVTLIIENLFGNSHNLVTEKRENFHCATANPVFEVPEMGVQSEESHPSRKAPCHSSVSFYTRAQPQEGMVRTEN